jgi:hypothetical protein
VSVPFSRALPSSFEGATRRSYGGKRHSVTVLTLASPHSVVQWRGWPHRAGGRRNSVGVGFPGGVRGPVWWGFTLDLGACGVPAHLMLWSGGTGAASWARGGGPTLASSEAEFRPRGRPALERGGVSPEGAPSPRAKWSFGVAAPGPSSEAEFRPRGAGAGCLLGRWCYSGRGCTRCGLSLVGSFAFSLFCEKLGFPPLIRGPLWSSPTIAPEPLRRYPLGTRRG